MKQIRFYFVAVGLFLLFFLAISGRAGVVVWSPDEAFHWSQPWRFFNGDLPFVHEWHLSMLFGVLATPIVALFSLFHEDTTGFVFFSRNLFALVWSISMACVWLRWCKISACGALLGVLAIGFYPPWCGSDFTYNSVGTLTMILAATLYATNERQRATGAFFAGFFYACAVLCCPHLIFLYLTYTVYGLMRERRVWGWLTLGSAVVGAVFFIWLFLRITPGQIIESLPGLLSDPEHVQRSPLILIRDCIGHFLFITHHLAWGHAAIMAGYGVTFALGVLDKRRAEHRSLHYALAAIPGLVLYGYYAIEPMVSLNVLMFPFFLSAVCLLFSVRDQPHRKSLIIACLIGAAYAIAISCSSNMGYYAMSFALETSIIPAVIVLVSSARGHRWLHLFWWALFIFHMSLLYPTIRWSLQARFDTSRNELKDGPMAGIRVDQTTSDNYNQLLADTKIMRSHPKVKNVVYFDHPNQWLCYASDKGVGVFSSWLSGVDEPTFKRLNLYWALNPDKKPEAMFVSKTHQAAIDWYMKTNEFELERLKSGNAILWRKGVR